MGALNKSSLFGPNSVRPKTNATFRVYTQSQVNNMRNMNATKIKNLENRIKNLEKRMKK